MLDIRLFYLKIKNRKYKIENASVCYHLRYTNFLSGSHLFHKRLQSRRQRNVLLPRLTNSSHALFFSMTFFCFWFVIFIRLWRIAVCILIFNLTSATQN